MKRRSLTLSFILLSTSLAHAQSGAEEAFAAAIKDLNDTGLFVVEVGSTHYQEDGDILTAQNVTYKLDWTLPGSLTKLDDSLSPGTKQSSVTDSETQPPETAPSEDAHIVMTMTIPTLTATGMRMELDGVSYDRMTYEGHQFLARIDMEGEDNDLSIKARALGKDVMENGFQPFLGEFKVAPSRPIGSVMDYIRPLLLKPVMGKYTSAGYQTTQLAGDGTVVEETEMGPLSMTDLQNGKIASYQIDHQKGEMLLKNMMAAEASTDKEPETALDEIPEKLTYEVGKTTYQGYDIAALWAAFDPNAPKPDDKAMVLREVNSGPISLRAKDTFELTIEPSVMKDFSLKQPETHFVPLLDQMIASKQSPDDMPKEEQQKLVRSFFDLLRGINLGLSENGAIKLTGTIPEGEFKDQSISLTIDGLRLSNFSGKGMDEASFTGLKYAGPPSVNLSLGRVALENLEFADYQDVEAFFLRSIEGQDPSPAETMKIAPEGYDVAIEDLSYEDAMANKVSLKSLKTSMKRKGLAIPALLSSRIDELKVSKSLLSHQLLNVLMTQLNLDDLTISEDIKAEWDEASDSVRIDPLDIKLDQIGRLNGSLAIGGIVRGYLEDPESAQAAAFTGTVLPSALTLSNLGGLDTLIDLAGSTAGMGPEQVREFAPSQLQATLSAFTKPAFAQMVAAEVRSFLSDPKSLKIVLNPGAPVAFGQIMGAMSQDPGSIPDLLNIGVSANQD